MDLPPKLQPYDFRMALMYGAHYGTLGVAPEPSLTLSGLPPLRYDAAVELWWDLREHLELLTDMDMFNQDTAALVVSFMGSRWRLQDLTKQGTVGFNTVVSTFG